MMLTNLGCLKTSWEHNLPKPKEYDIENKYKQIMIKTQQKRASFSTR